MGLCDIWREGFAWRLRPAPGGRQRAQGCLGFPPAGLEMGKLRQEVWDGRGAVPWDGGSAGSRPCRGRVRRSKALSRSFSWAVCV